MDDVRNRKSEDVMEILYEENYSLDNKEMKKPLSLQDKKSICLLTFLYILQGIPLGLAGAVPYMLQSRGVSYSQQATFSLAFWPFSLKILWAPIVDSIYSRRIGRRKSWLIPSQLLIGAIMLVISYRVTTWLTVSNITSLTAAFFLLNFLAATQDVAVDGWALTMLSTPALGWASTCNSVGQTTGYFTAFIVFLALESTEFSNTWLRSEPLDFGIVTFEGFLFFWSFVFLVTTVLVLLLKHEDDPGQNVRPDGDGLNLNKKAAGDHNDNHRETERELGIVETYQTLARIIKLRPVIAYVITLFFIKVGFSAADSITGLKLMEKGVSKEKMAFIGSMVLPVQIALALVISKHTTGPRPLNIFITAAIPRYLYGFVFIGLVYFTQSFQLSDGTYPFTYYVILTVGYASHQMVVYPMFVSVMAFYAKISDPTVGGTYMTFLNTITNLSGNIPNTLMLYLVDQLTIKSCVGGPMNGSACSSNQALQSCIKRDPTVMGPAGQCVTSFDGYYPLVIGSTVLGLITIICRRSTLLWIQQLPLSAWRVF